MKTITAIIISLSILALAGCWDMYNEAADDLGGYDYFLAVTRVDYVSIFSLNSSGSPKTPPNDLNIGSTNYYPAVHPSGNYFYVPVIDTNTLLVYKVINNGQLSLIDSETTDTHPYAVKVHPSGKYVYVSNWDPATISTFQVNEDGKLSSIGSLVSTASSSYAGRMDIDPSGSYLFIINAASATSSISIFQISNDGLLTQVTGSPVTDLPDNNDNPWNIIVHPNGKYLYVTSYALLSDPAEVIYIYEIQNGTTLPLQYITYVIIQDDSSSNPSIAIHPNGNFLYAKSGYSSPVLAYQINTDGTLNNIDSTDPDSIPSGYCDIIVHPYGKNIYILDAGGGERLNYNIFLNEDGTFNHSYTHLNYSLNGSQGFALIRKKNR